MDLVSESPEESVPWDVERDGTCRQGECVQGRFSDCWEPGFSCGSLRACVFRALIWARELRRLSQVPHLALSPPSLGAADFLGHSSTQSFRSSRR